MPTRLLDRIVLILQRAYLFHGLTPGQLLQIASRFRLETRERDTVIFTAGEPGDCFYVILSGRVRVSARGRGRNEKLLAMLGPGDYFGEDALLFDRPRDATIVTVENSELLRMHRDEFHQLLQDYPEVRMNLSATARSRRLARRRDFTWLDSDEVIYYITRKHDVFLILGLFLPVLMALLSIPVFVFAADQIGNLLMYEVAMTAGVVLLGGGILWGLWNFLDWENDYYIVTNQRVIWQEKLLGLYDSRREAPLDSVLAVNVTSSQIGRILNYGNVNVRTFTGGIDMRRMNRPYQFASFVEGFKQRVIAQSKEEEAQQMEQALEQALIRSTQELDPNSPPYVPPVPMPVKARPAKPKKPSSLREKLNTFLKVRYEQDGVITYRKHWFMLFRRAWIPMLISLAIWIPTVWLAWQDYVNMTAMVLNPTIMVLFALVNFVLFLWFGYDYWDWSNDIYRINAEQIFDIERKPLGREVKKTANLDSILSIEHERQNLLGILFNFGYVTVNVGETKFTFNGVYNPDQVHQDISDFREALNRRKRLKDAERERERMVNWLVAFHNATEKLEDFENNSDGSGFSR